MSASLSLVFGLLLAAGPDSAAVPNPVPSPEVASLRAWLEASKTQTEALDQKIKVLERLHENDLEDAAAAAKAAVRLQANASGLWIRSADTAYAIRFRGIVRSGAAWDLVDENDKTLDQFQNTTVRFGFDGILGKALEFKINSDWSKGSVALQDAYLDIKYAPGLKARIGKFQVPLEWERFVSPSDLLFYDRALPAQIGPNRDVGAQLFGAFASDRVQYAVGVFNGGADASNLNNDANDDKDLYGRIWTLPLKGVSEYVDGLGIGFAANAGFHANSTPSGYKVTSGNSFFSWKAADTVDGIGYRFAPQAQWTFGPFLAYGEWIQSVQEIKRGITVVATDSIGKSSTNKGVVYRYNKTTLGVFNQDLSVSAWQAALSWVITGEDANVAGVSPRHPFNPTTGDVGAFEISARVSGLSVDDKAFTNANFADSTVSARSVLTYGAALNWHLIKGSRLQIGFERTDFNDGALVDPSAAIKVVRDRKSENQLFVVASTSF